MADASAVPQAELPLTPAATPPAPAAPAKAAPKRFELPPEPKAEEPKPAAAPAASEPPKPAQNTEAEAPSTEPEGEKPEEVTPEQEAKRAGRRFERKLDKAYRQRAEALAKTEFLEKQLAEARQAALPKAPEGEPRLEQFDYDPEKYAAAKAEYAKNQAGKDLAAKQREAASREEYQRLTSSWSEKVERAEDKYEDFDTVVGELQPNTPFVAAIMEADNGEDIAYHLGKNPKEAERIAKLAPRAQIREIGKLEAKLQAEPAKPRTPSKAPAPIVPVSASATPATPADVVKDDKADMARWIKARQKQVHGRF